VSIQYAFLSIVGDLLAELLLQVINKLSNSLTLVLSIKVSCTHIKRCVLKNLSGRKTFWTPEKKEGGGIQHWILTFSRNIFSCTFSLLL